MFFYSRRVKLGKRLLKNFRYYNVLAGSTFIKPGNKILYIDPSNVRLNRYFYNFLKFFQIMGYVVYFPKNKEIVNNLFGKQGESVFVSWLLNEKFIKLGKPSNKSEVIYINKENISNDYFQTFSSGADEPETYHVPMSEFPVLYHRYNWREDFEKHKIRKKSVFMIGNIDKNLYNNIKRKNIFEIITRPDVADFLATKDYYLHVSSFEDLTNFINGSEDSKVIIVDTSTNFQIDGNNLKGTLKEFSFYLALPGINIPQSHNIIEAMSVGCIPVLHKTYADLFIPPLENRVNSIVYQDLAGLNTSMKEIFGYNNKFITRLREHSYLYYKDNLAPEAVVGRIENNNFKKIYLQAEEYSLTNFKGNKQ